MTGAQEQGQEWSRDKRKRYLSEVTIHRGDVSLVSAAANPNATAGLRAEDSTLEQRERIAERVGRRVCGPYAPALDLPGVRTRRRVGLDPPPIRSYMQEARRNRARLTLRAHPGSNASVEGKEDSPRYAQAQIDKLGAEGKAFRKSDGTYGWPIVDGRDVSNAVRDFIRMKPGTRTGIRTWIVKRAHLIGAESRLPEAWRSKAKPGVGPNEPQDTGETVGVGDQEP